MELSIDSDERGNKRQETGRLEAQGQSRPVVDNGRQCTPEGRAADAFADDLYARYWTGLVRYVNSMLRDPHQAEEIAQETMLRAWRHADILGPDRGSPWSWLRRVAHNIMIDRVRYKQARPTEPDEIAAETNADVVTDHSDDVVNSLYVANAIARLRPAHRAVLSWSTTTTGRAPKPPRCSACPPEQSSPG
jgi:RNA polymerase sigma factor (sigma-70 family)